ncbi:MAG: hypothetical protein ACT4PX_12200, partial [Actinomycetota bacterium]
MPGWQVASDDDGSGPFAFETQSPAADALVPRDRWRTGVDQAGNSGLSRRTTTSLGKTAWSEYAPAISSATFRVTTDEAWSISGCIAAQIAG